MKKETVVGIFIQDNKLLMEQRKQRKVYANFLMCPSGHVKEGESLLNAFKREMKEELQIDVKTSIFLFNMEDTDPFSGEEFSHNFMLVESYEGKIEKSKEANELKWLTYDEIRKAQPVEIVKRLIERLHEMKML